MAYQLFDRAGKIVENKELQNRAVWYEHGISKEKVFVNRYSQSFAVSLNPEKIDKETEPDLIFKGRLADLKCQNTPLFTANFYKIDPNYAVTFNLKDALSYGQWGKNYPNLYIIYWVDWVAVQMTTNTRNYQVRPLTGIWGIPFSQLEEMRQNSPIHWYNQRTHKQETNSDMRRKIQEFEPRLVEGNFVRSIRATSGDAACSYVFDVRNFNRLE